jgi:hypothetical protein
MKIIFLIIDSDTPFAENYERCRNIWKKYMNSDSNIKCFFIKYSEEISEEYIINEENNYILCKGKESYIPGILNKTVTSMEAVLKKYDFDFLIRTNLSSFWNFKNLRNHIETLPKEKCINAVIGNHIGIKFPSGAGFILSIDMVKLLTDKKDTLEFFALDDVMIGNFYNKFNVNMIPGKRFDFTENLIVDKIDKMLNESVKEAYHYRVLCDRNMQDMYVRDKLYEKIYT